MTMHMDEALLEEVSALSVDAKVLTHDPDFRRISGLRVIGTLT